MSSRIAEVVGPFAGFSENRDAFLEVIAMHRKALEDVNRMRRATKPLVREPGSVEGVRGLGRRSTAIAMPR